ncbi:MAG: prepilin-type N-terminal cleavage/methylation domain-containing protein [Deltaproteobacteria bacterium]|nr:prepilin-type N-terminal cleavage/methylation domain-containing protein [Deltaproteobacteria bacterium]
MGRKYSISGPSGFTILELMLSLTIMGLVLLIIFGALRIGTRAWEKGEKDVAVHQRQRAVLGLLSRQIASACIYEIKMGDDAFYFKGSEETMAFVSRSPIVPGALTGVVFVKYMIQGGDGDGQKQLKLYEKDAGFLTEADFQNQREEDLFTLMSGVQDLQFEYLKGGEGETDWQTSWDPSEKTGLPLAVKIVLKQDDETAPISLMVPIRCRKE